MRPRARGSGARRRALVIHRSECSTISAASLAASTTPIAPGATSTATAFTPSPRWSLCSSRGCRPCLPAAGRTADAERLVVLAVDAPDEPVGGDDVHHGEQSRGLVDVRL